MNRNYFTEKKEQDWYERFEKGAVPGDDPDERYVYKVFHGITQGLHSIEIPKIDSQIIIHQLEKELGKKTDRFQYIESVLERIPTPVFAIICISLIFIGVMNFKKVISPFFEKNTVPVSEIALQDAMTKEYISPPFLWKSRLQQGRFVTVPDDVDARIALAEGSIIHCSPETQIAFCEEEDRMIDIRSGTITAHVAHIPGSTFTVETPMGRIEVLGTVFHVTVQPTK